MIGIKARSEKTKEVAQEIKSNDKVISFFEVTGETDMILITRFLDREDMNSFIKSLQKIEGIKSTETNVILTEPKLEDNMSLDALEL
jgi:DNA-binding Lrp family transcriptional regulator